MVYVAIGMAVLGFATFEFLRGEIWFASWDWIWIGDYFHRDDHPIFYWAYLSVEVIVGLTLLIAGAAQLWKG